MRARSFHEFYSKFIQLALDLEHTLEMLIQNFQHKLTLRLQDELNSVIEVPTIISVLAKKCLRI